MKLLRWAMAGASAYVVYKYSIGKKAKGEAVFSSPDDALGNDAADGETLRPKKPEPRKAKAKPKA
jgi:hypothetical protein